MIRYKSGMTDVITPFDVAEEPEKQEYEVIKKVDPEHVVFYHSVKKGQTLKKIAEMYNATVSDIIVWNSLPKDSRPTAPLTPGTQLTIFLPK